MSISIDESFTVAAPAERVWRFLTDPAQVVRCLPGAELTEAIDHETYAGRVRVKVGPIVTSYAGRARLVILDDAPRHMQLTGEGKESGGVGSARLSLSGSVSERSDRSSEVRISATIDIVGKVMQFGRGMVDSISRQLFRQFAESVTTALESAPATPPGASATGPADDGAGSGASVLPPASGAVEDAPPPPALPRPSERDGGGDGMPPIASAASSGGAAPSTIRSTPQRAATKELRLVPLLFRALASFIRARIRRRR